MRSPWWAKPLTRDRLRSHAMRCFMRSSGPSLLARARRFDRELLSAELCPEAGEVLAPDRPAL
eukprot:1468806-Alexandrium_andersonii.AAC.1